jgi:hypothetical protein
MDEVVGGGAFPTGWPSRLRDLRRVVPIVQTVAVGVVIILLSLDDYTEWGIRVSHMRSSATKEPPMQYAPALTQRVAALHQRDLLAQADHDRLVAQAHSTTRPSSRKAFSMPTLSAIRSLVQSLRLSPRAASIAAVAIALVAGLVLGPDAVDAKVIISGGR